MLRGVVWEFATDVSGKQTGPTYKGKVVKKSSGAARLLNVALRGCSETSVTKYQLTPRKVPEERRLQLPAVEAGNLAFCMLKFYMILELNLKGTIKQSCTRVVRKVKNGLPYKDIY